jgi:hypothetical protein
MGFLLSLGWVVSRWLLVCYGSVTVRLRDAIEASSLRNRVITDLLDWLRHRLYHCFLRVKPRSSLPCH